MARILVVDDDEKVRAAIAAALGRAGHRVVLAGDGEEALRHYRAGDFDLVITDIVMPRMDGLETVKALRRAGAVAIVAMSGAAHAGAPYYLRAAEALGADAVLVKPFTLAELKAAVAWVLPSPDQQADRQDDGGRPQRPDPALDIDQRDQRDCAEHDGGLVRPEDEPVPHAALLARNR